MAADLVDRLGFDAVDAGPLTQSWRFEPETAAYTLPYAAEPGVILEGWRRMMDDLAAGRVPAAADRVAGTPLPASRLRQLLAEAERVLTADRIVP